LKPESVNLTHGGNVYEIASRLGCSPDDVLDFSASINPLGPPPGLRELLDGHYHRLQHYPDIAAGALLDALAQFHDVPADRIVAGNGSTELIYWLPKALGINDALVALPTFGEYCRAFEIQGVRLKKLYTSPEAGFQPTVEGLEAAMGSSPSEAVMFTHPGSPSGMLLSPDVREWLAGAARKGTLCILDEVFIDFCEEESLKGLLRSSPNLVIIRSATKFYGLPGLRLGYLLTSEEIAPRVKRILPPWSVNTLAQAAGVYCLGRDDYRGKTLELAQSERERLAAALGSVEGLSVFPGRANYLLVRIGGELPDADSLRRHALASDRILIRDCSSFEGLDGRYFRVAVRLPVENDRLFRAVEEWASDCRESRAKK
jgi:threonine-phosphate decarboxylase